MDLAGPSEERAQSQAAVDGKLLAQVAELQQLQQGLADVGAQARRAETAIAQQLEHRTEIVLDALTEHFDTVFDKVKVAGEALDWKVQGKANELWWMAQNLPGSVGEMVADIEGRLQRQTRPEGGSHEKKVRIRIPDRTNPEVVAGDRGMDKDGFDRVFEKIRDGKEPLSSEEFSKLVSEYGHKPHDTEEEDCEMKNLGRHSNKVLMNNATQDAKKTAVGAPQRDGVEAYTLLTRQYNPFSYDVAAQMLEDILLVGRANPKNIDQLEQAHG